MLKELPTHGVAVKFDARMRSAIYDFGKQSGSMTMSDAIRSLVLLGLERSANVESTLIKAGYRTGVNRGLGLIKQTLMTALNEEMSRIDATDDLTAE